DPCLPQPHAAWPAEQPAWLRAARVESAGAVRIAIVTSCRTVAALSGDRLLPGVCRPDRLLRVVCAGLGKHLRQHANSRRLGTADNAVAPQHAAILGGNGATGGAANHWLADEVAIAPLASSNGSAARHFRGAGSQFCR